MPVRNVVIGQSVSSEKRRLAKELRQNQTPAERLLWSALRTNKQGIHFRRQQIIDGYIADFYCHAIALIVELDGGVHDTQQEYDAARDMHLIERGFRILRFKNEEIEKNLNGIVKQILEACK